MKYYARIINVVVVQVIIAAAKDFKAMKLEGEWIECSADTSVGDKYENSSFLRPPSKAEVIDEAVLQERLERWRQTFSVPTYKLEIELEERGLMTTVQALIDRASRSTQIGWEKSPTVRRMSPTMLALAQHPSLALTAEDLDDIFKSADLREL